MRRLLALISVAGLAIGLATSAQAAPFTGEVSFGLSTLTPLVASGSGSGASAPFLMTIATPSWASSAATGADRITLDPTAAAPLTALSVLLVAPGPCTFTGTPPRGPCALGGTANALVGGAPFLVVPLGGLGVPGRIDFGPYGSWIDAQSWVAATATPTVAGSPVLDDYGVPFYTVGYDARTPGGGGVIKLVAPGGLMSTLGGDLPLFVSMTLDYAPEPGTLLLLVFSSAGLVLAGGLSSRRPRGSARKRRALLSLLVLLAVGMVALWASSALAGLITTTASTTTSTTTTSTTTTSTTTTLPLQECLLECRADKRDCEATARDDNGLCRASCMDDRASNLEACSALPSRERGECNQEAAAAAVVCLEICRAARQGALDSCGVSFESCEADCTGDATLSQ